MNFIKWVKKHKRALIIAGISITALISLAVYNKDSINELWNYLRKRINEHPESVKKVTHTIKNTVNTVADVKEGNNVTYIKTKSLETISEKTSDNKVIDINSYFRNLPKGRKASPEKIKEVQELGLIMPAGKTYVNAHKRCIA